MNYVYRYRFKVHLQHITAAFSVLFAMYKLRPLPLMAENRMGQLQSPS